MYSNDQVASLVTKYVKYMEGFINTIESEISKEEPNLRVLSNAAGKLSQIYSFITELTGTYSGFDARYGGHRESSWVTDAEVEEIPTPRKGK